MISVSIATYNGSMFIEQQLLSIKNQILPVDEVVICDDKSSDDTVEICRKFIEKHNLKNWNIFENEQNLGYCLNYYKAIDNCHGDIIFLCDQDDVWEENKTKRMTEVLNENPEIKVLSSTYDVISGTGRKLENTGIPYVTEKNDSSIDYISYDSLIGCSYIRGFATCFKSEIKKYLKPIDVKSLLAHDWFINSIGTIIGKSAVLNEVLVHYRFHHDNVSLSDMERTSFLGDREKRKRGLYESIEAHSYFLINIFSLSDKDRKNTEKMIRLEETRLKFLEKRNFFVWLFSIRYLSFYKRYYKSLMGGIRVWLGDFFYCYNINFEKK